MVIQKSISIEFLDSTLEMSHNTIGKNRIDFSPEKIKRILAKSNVLITNLILDFR